MQRSWIAFVLVFTCGCEAVATRAPRPVSIEASGDFSDLFPPDGEVMTDGEIAHALDAPWTVPDDFRIALVEIGHRSEFVHAYARDWSTRPSGTSGLQVASEAIGKLLMIDGVFDASYLPTFMVPARASLAQLRAAAARYQADWLLLYSTTVRADPNYRFFARDELDGFCVVECAIVDTRTGLVIFTSRSTRTIDERADDGEGMAALVQRAERAAVNGAMYELAESITAFVDAALRTETRARRPR